MTTYHGGRPVDHPPALALDRSLSSVVGEFNELRVDLCDVDPRANHPEVPAVCIIIVPGDLSGTKVKTLRTAFAGRTHVMTSSRDYSS